MNKQKTSRPNRAARLRLIYERLFEHFGPQDWWPGSGDRDEIIIGAILTQNTTWKNVEKSLIRLIEANACTLPAIARLDRRDLADLIRSSGYFNDKARKLHALADWFEQACGFDLDALDEWEDSRLREGLLSIWGVGEETADDIMVYAFARPSFVIDAYTRRLMERHGFVASRKSYADLQRIWEDALPRDAAVYNEAHALIVEVAKAFCTRRSPNCEECPLYLDEAFASATARRRWERERQRLKAKPFVRRKDHRRTGL